MEESGLVGHLGQKAPSPVAQVTVNQELAGPVELLSQAWKIARSRFWAIIGCFILGYLAFIPLGGILFVPFGYSLLRGGTSEGFVASLGIGLMVAFALFWLVGMVIFTWIGVALVEIVAGADEKLGLWEAVKKAFPKIPGLIWLVIVSTSLVMGSYIPFLIPAVAVGVWISFGQYVYITQGVGGLKALRISREYVRGRFWGVLGRYLFLILIPLALQLMAGGIGVMLGEEAAGILVLLSMIVTIPLWIVIMVYPYVLFRNLRELRGEITPDQVEEGKTKWVLLGLWGVLGWLILPVGAVILLLMINPAGQLQKAREAGNKSNLNILEMNIRSYEAVNRRYPMRLDDLIPEFLDELPVGNYEYKLLKNGMDYELCITDSENNQQCVTSLEESPAKQMNDEWNLPQDIDFEFEDM